MSIVRILSAILASIFGSLPGFFDCGAIYKTLYPFVGFGFGPPEKFRSHLGDQTVITVDPNGRDGPRIPSAEPQVVQKINYTDENVKFDSELQVAWQEKMSSGPFKVQKYGKVAVLLLSWDPTHDDLKGVQDEVEDLKQTFERKFGYEVTSMRIPSVEPGDVQLDLVTELSPWLRANKSPDNLLIIYYAGHGRAGPIGERARLELYSNQANMHSFIWQRVEYVIQMSKANIFFILDCCHAGYVFKTRGSPRAYEYLIATGPEDTTRAPGPNSFTRALIFSLEALANENRPFTSAQLASKIKNAPGFPQHQEPNLSSPEKGLTKGRILFYPVGTGDGDERNSPAIEDPAPRHASSLDLKSRVLTLHFDLSDIPTRENVEEFADLFNNHLLMWKLGVQSIRWGGLEPNAVWRTVKAFTDSLHRRRILRRQHQDLTTQIQALNSVGLPVTHILRPITDVELQLDLDSLKHQSDFLRPDSTLTPPNSASLLGPPRNSCLAE